MSFWTILGPDPSCSARVICQCRCRNIVSVVRKTIKSGASTKCVDCARRRHGQYHGTKRTSEYLAFRNAQDRCRNPKHFAYVNYGARGIEFRFHSFQEFIAEIGRKPSPDLSLDRINNNGHYEKGNIRWATKSQQNSNQRRSFR